MKRSIPQKMRIYISHTNEAGHSILEFSENIVNAVNDLIHSLYGEETKAKDHVEYVQAYIGGPYKTVMENYDVVIFIPDSSMDFGHGVLKEITKAIKANVPAFVYNKGQFYIIESVLNNGSNNLSKNLSPTINKVDIKNAFLYYALEGDVIEEKNTDVI